jgi:protein AFG1
MGYTDPLPLVANELAKQCRVLCFDEFQVTDIADAMILRRLLQELHSRGVVLFTTSNRHPDGESALLQQKLIS